MENGVADWWAWLKPIPGGWRCWFNRFRLIAVAAQAAAIYISWELWQSRESPPMFPALPLPTFEVGWLLLGTLAAVVIVPRVGCWLHAAALLFAILQDQTREQPEFISLAILMLGTLPHPVLRSIARWHLVALWFYAGLHKLVSLDYLRETSVRIFRELYGFEGIDIRLAQILGGAIAVMELGVGILALVPRTRRLASWGAVLMHFSIFIAATRLLRAHGNPLNLVLLVGAKLFHLTPPADLENAIPGYWHEPVYPWNLALIFAGFTFISSWEATPWKNFVRSPVWARPILATVFLSPLLWYAGCLDAYLAYCLYSNNTPLAFIFRPSAENENAQRSQLPEKQRSPAQDQIVENSHRLIGYLVSEKLHAPLPPNYRLIQEYYRRVADLEKDQLELYDPRWWLSPDGLCAHVYRGQQLEAAGDRYDLQLNAKTGQFDLYYAGYWVYFFPSGKPSHAGSFLKGQAEGTWTYWSESGRKEAEGPMVNGRMDGVWKYWQDDGTVLEQHFSDGHNVAE